MIEAKKLVKTYGKGETALNVLKELSFVIPEGQFCAITGRSGSGKSTLLYQLGLLDYPTGGSVYIGEIDTNNLSNEDRTLFRLHELGYVFQDYALIPDLTSIENVAIPLLMKGIPRHKAEELAESALLKVGLGDAVHNIHLPSQLSGGQQQRVAIARAIGHNPKILFADEPTANLDSETAKIVLDTFKALHKSGQTIVMVTHEPEYAKLAERIITLSDGVIVSDEMVKR
jgi:putative ABC transport system ATP-binding protein